MTPPDIVDPPSASCASLRSSTTMTARWASGMLPSPSISTSTGRGFAVPLGRARPVFANLDRLARALLSSKNGVWLAAGEGPVTTES